MENTSDSAVVMPDSQSNENDYWTSVADSETQMLFSTLWQYNHHPL